MNSRQKEVLQARVRSEKATLNKIKKVYEEAYKEIEEKINVLSADKLTQSKIYQKQYQIALQQQVSAILDNLNSKQYDTVDQYLKDCYEDAFIGAMYDLQGQGIPLVFPINQEDVARSIIHNTKLKKPLYEAMGIDVTKLKKVIQQEISRGFATASDYTEMARNIRNKGGVSMRKAFTIARTEGHRIHQEAAADAQQKAKDAGADVVKQWDSTLDKRTRTTHQRLDGQLRELDEPFEINGHKAMYPGGFGIASEDINCRCVTLQRARWALDEEEFEIMKERAKFFALDKMKDFNSFKEKYLQLPQNADKMNMKKLEKPIESSDPVFDMLIKGANSNKVEYKPVMNHVSQLTPEEIISVLSGGDNTSGSCASLGLAYIGQKQGWDILDFRGGDSQKFFSNGLNLLKLSEAKGIKKLLAEGKSSVTVGNRLLKQCEVGKEYYLVAGRHAAIVRKIEDGTLQYLELQSASRSGWTNFNANPRNTLHTRFGCTQSISGYGSFMIDIDESDFSTDDFKSLLGFINTAEDAQKKGKYGTIK